MKKTLVVASVRVGLHASCCGKRYKVQVWIGTTAEENIIKWILLISWVHDSKCRIILQHEIMI